MNTSKYLPLFMTMMSPPENRDEILQMTLPTMLPVNPNVQGAVMAMSAGTVATQHSTELKKVANSVTNEIFDAIQMIENEGGLNDKHLNQLPLIKKYNLSDNIQARLNPQSREVTG